MAVIWPRPNLGLLLAGIAMLAGCSDGNHSAGRPEPLQQAGVAAPARLAPPVFVEPVEGAPAQWGMSRRLAAALEARDVPASADGAGRAGYRLAGRAQPTGPEGGGRQVKLVWELLDPDGNQVGDVVQLASMPEESWREADAATLDAVAEAAAASITPVVPGAGPAAAGGDGTPVQTADGSGASGGGGSVERLLQPARNPAAEAESAPSREKSAKPEAATGAGPAPSPPPKSKSAVPLTVYWVQVGAFRESTTAKTWYATLKKRNPDILGSVPHITTPVDLGGSKGVMYRVRVGPFPSEAAAGRMCRDLKAVKIDCFIWKAS